MKRELLSKSLKIPRAIEQSFFSPRYCDLLARSCVEQVVLIGDPIGASTILQLKFQTYDIPSGGCVLDIPFTEWIDYECIDASRNVESIFTGAGPLDTDALDKLTYA